MTSSSLVACVMSTSFVNKILLFIYFYGGEGGGGGLPNLTNVPLEDVGGFRSHMMPPMDFLDPPLIFIVPTIRYL